MITKKITLSTWKINHEIIYANEGEVNCRYIEVSFKDESENNISLSNRNVTFYAKKPDGTNIFNYCTIDTVNNTATVELTSQALSCPGILECEFQIFDSNNVLLKVNGVRIVVSLEKGFSEAIESSSEFNVLTSAINEIEEITGYVGDLSTLDTTEKDTITGAINELKEATDLIGDLSELTTTEKDTLTEAINEVNTQVIPSSIGGSGATTALNALINLGISDTNQTNFTANSYSDWLSQVQSYVDANLQTRRPFAFNAGWSGVGFGCGLAYQTLDTTSNEELKFLILFNQI